MLILFQGDMYRLKKIKFSCEFSESGPRRAYFSKHELFVKSAAQSGR